VRSVSAIYCFNLEHPCLVRSWRGPCLTPADNFGFRIRCPSGDEHPSTQRFHAARVTVVDADGVRRRSSNHYRACRASSMCQLADPSVVAHTSKLRLERCATRSVKTSPFCDPARLPSKGTFLRPTSCDACRAPPGVDPVSRACPAFVGFAANVPSLCAPSSLRSRAAFANAVVSIRPPFTSACLIDADASLGQTQPFDFCNEFSNYDTRARTPRALSSPAAGVGPAVVATHDALLTLLVSSSLDAKKIRARCAAASYA
jgi:hypothetical protein